MRSLLLPVAALVVLAACTPAKVTPAEAVAKAGPRPTQAEAEALARKWCESNLKDPTSFLLQNVRVLGPGMSDALFGDETRRRYGWVVTWEVNAKNSFGGYVGWDLRKELVRDGAILQTVLVEPIPTK
jgi:hypothetical protein